MRVVAVVAAPIVFLTALFLTAPAHACSCLHPPLHIAVLGASVIAEVRVLEVGPADPDNDLGSQALRVRIERVFKGPRRLVEGTELWVEHQQCNSAPYGADSVGARWIQFFRQSAGRLVFHYCSTRFSAWAPLPLVLIEERERRLRSRR